MSYEPAPAGNDPLAGMSRWQKARLVLKVVELRVRFIALLAGTGLVFGYWDTIWNHYEKWTRPAAPHLAAGPASADEYFCPMHPNVVRDTAGNCPICGMPLSKRAKGQAQALAKGTTARIALSPDRIRQAGIRTAEVGYRPLAESITTVGEVRFDERRLARIASRVKGSARVESLRVNFTGTAVQVGEPLAELYSPELSQAVRELLMAQKSLSTSSAARYGDPADLVRLSREKLGFWGLTAAQIDGILKTGQASDRLAVLSPISGVVVRKNIVEGQYVNEGDSLFEVADLGRLWVQAQVFESQIGAIEVGQAVEATVEAYPGETFAGTVAFIDPALDPATRTVNVRYDLDNARGRLKPGMFATVTLHTPVARMPAFRDRLAKAEGGEVLKVGLSADEQGICPVTGQLLDSMGQPMTVSLPAGKVWVCCEACETPLTKEPDRYLARLRSARVDEVLSVPESAVVDTGRQKVVYVETADPGTFEGRSVVVGPRSGDMYPVIEGLRRGDRVATEGAFLIDAESRLNPTAVEGAP
jgi:Cu(I)/Ag(I) efflux system membrane fusion protein